MRSDRFFYVREFLHEFFVYLQAARRIYDQNVKASALRFRARVLCDLYRVFFAVLGEDFRIHLLPDDLELVDGRWTIDVARREHGLLSDLLEVRGEFAARRGLTCSLKSDHHEDREPGRRIREFAAGAAHQGRQFLVYYLYDLLRRREALQDFRSEAFFLHVRHKVLYDLIVHVRFEQSQFDLSHRGIYVRFLEYALASEFIECFLKFIGKAFECHDLSFRYPSMPRSIPPSFSISSSASLSPRQISFSASSAPSAFSVFSMRAM